MLKFTSDEMHTKDIKEVLKSALIYICVYKSPCLAQGSYCQGASGEEHCKNMLPLAEVYPLNYTFFKSPCTYIPWCMGGGA